MERAVKMHCRTSTLKDLQFGGMVPCVTIVWHLQGTCPLGPLEPSLAYRPSPPRTEWISLSVREMAREPDKKVVQDFYTEVTQREIRIQHILYGADDLRQLFKWIDQGVVLRPASLSILWVLGRYSSNGNSDPTELNQVEADFKLITVEDTLRSS